MTDAKRHDVSETICRGCGRWLLAGTPPAPPSALLCPKCQAHLNHQQKETNAGH